MKQLFEKKEYPQSKPEKEGEYYDTNKGNIYWDGIMFLSPMESPISLTTIKWFFEPVPEVVGSALQKKEESEEKSFEELFIKHQEFTKNTFPNATAKGSLIKLIEEANETIDELRLTDYDGNALPLEYVDCMMCLLDSLQRSNIDFKQFKRYFKMKLSINLSRTWKQNKDGSYSHIK